MSFSYQRASAFSSVSARKKYYERLMVNPSQEQSVYLSGANSNDSAQPEISKMDTKLQFENVSTANNSKLFKTKLLADVVFVLHDTKTKLDVKILAHKLILASECKNFEKKFCVELNGQIKPEIAVNDISAEAFNEFLQFFYLPNFELSSKHIGNVLKLMGQFQVEETLPKCEDIYRKFATSSNNAFIYQFHETAVKLNLSEKLKKSLKVIIGQNPKLAFQQSSDPKHILQTMQFQCDEFDIFMGLIAWATKSLVQKKIVAITIENIKVEIGDTLYEIRFPTMTSQQFLTCVERFPNLFDVKDHLDILHFIDNQRKLKSAKRFSTVPRSNINYLYAHTTEAVKDRPLTYGKTKFARHEPIYDVTTADHFEMSGKLKRCVLRPSVLSGIMPMPQIMNTVLTIKCQNSTLFTRNVNFTKATDSSDKITGVVHCYVYVFDVDLPIVENRLYTFQFGNGTSARSGSINGTCFHVFYFAS